MKGEGKTNPKINNCADVIYTCSLQCSHNFLCSPCSFLSFSALFLSHLLLEQQPVVHGGRRRGGAQPVVIHDDLRQTRTRSTSKNEEGKSENRYTSGKDDSMVTRLECCLNYRCGLKNARQIMVPRFGEFCFCCTCASICLKNSPNLGTTF